MADFLLSWQMDRRLAQKLIKKQYFRYYFLKYFVGWVLLAESLVFVLIPLNNRTLFLYIFAAVMVGTFVWIYYYINMIPDKDFQATYKAEFYDDNFVITGKRYTRTYTYEQIDKLVEEGRDIYLLTSKEGIIIPLRAFEKIEQREAFIAYMKRKLL